LRKRWPYRYRRLLELRQDQKTNPPWHDVAKTLDIQNKERILKAARV
jgi:hypothetical protein